MLHKIKWNHISREARDVVFKDLKLFNESRVNGKKDKEVLKRLFDHYNNYVSFKYPRVGSSMACGKCVGVVVRFFTNELEKCQN